MAFTEQNKADAYLFFVLAFNAAPGTVYGGQIVEAYESGMTTAEIVAQYVEKTAFTSVYPTTQTNAEFAASLVANVTSSQTSATVKSAAETDIVAALAAGWTKAQVITQILGNLANKTVADAEWGATVAQLNNKIAVAKVLTEGDKALNTEDATLLKGPLSGVTEDVATVQKALDAAGALKDKLTVYTSALDAQTAYVKELNTLQENSPAKTAAALQADAKAVAEGALNPSVTHADGSTSTVSVYLAADSAAVKAAKLSDWKAANAKDQKTAQTELSEANAALAKDATASAAISALNTATATETSAKAAKKSQDAAYQKALGELKAADLTITDVDYTAATQTAGVLVTDATFVVTNAKGTLTYTVSADGKLSDPVFTGGAVAKDFPGAVAFGAAALATAVADGKALLATADVVAKKATVTGLTGASKTAADNAIAAQDKLADLKADAAAVTKAEGEVAKAAVIVAEFGKIDTAIEKAGEALEAAGYELPELLDGTVTSLLDKSEIYLATGKGVADTSIASFAGKDAIFVGTGYSLNAAGDLTKGNDAALEVFFKANGNNTDVYVEQKAFASSATGTDDLIKITLTGVAADKLVLKDGFITVAA
jgi:hypothetical protein